MLIMALSAMLALTISLLTTPLMRRLAIRFKIYASPNHRTIHKTLIPKLGGLSIFISFTMGIMIYAFTTGNFENLWGLLLGGGIVLLVGFLDDIYNLSCYQKLFGQILAALIAVYFGLMIQTVSLPFDNILELGYAGVFLSVLWIVTITNAMNLLDGLDGLASAIGILIALFIFLWAGFFQNMELVAMAVILIAVLLGFLKYNKPPARIFMGDSGSLFLGFSLACLSLKAISLPGSGTNFLILLVLFAIPLTDTTLAVFRRVSKGKHPFSPDKKHIHHRLLELGFNQSAAVLIIITATSICGLVGLILIRANFQQTFILLFGIGVFFILFLRKLGCFDFLADKYVSRNIREVTFDQKSTCRTKYDSQNLYASRPSTESKLNRSVELAHSTKKHLNKRKARTPA